ncbi:MAG: hypothetical protein HY329_23175 [Chloroflexi bacterium]|nr:hypothetical protein [Chloroflexota bacterium]
MRSAQLGGRLPGDSYVDFSSPTLAKALARIASESERRAREVLAFYRDFRQCLERLTPLLRQGGHACFVVGNRRVKGVQLETDRITAELGAPLGLELEEVTVRSIPSKTMPLRNSPSNVPGQLQQTMQHEYVVALRRRLS